MDDLDALLEGSTYTLWVEGRRVVRSWDDEAKTAADTLEQAAQQLDLKVFREVVVDGLDLPDESITRRRWTHRRIGADLIHGYLVSQPGIKFTDLVEMLYREPPWTDLQRQQAGMKLRVALNRLKTQGRAVKRYDEHGVERWQVPGVATGLRLTPAGTVAPLADEAGLPRAPLLADDLQRGAIVLRRFEIFDQLALSTDPHLYEDLARQVYEEMRRGT